MSFETSITDMSYDELIQMLNVEYIPPDLSLQSFETSNFTEGTPKKTVSSPLDKLKKMFRWRTK